jgi:hypothetical protein
MNHTHITMDLIITTVLIRMVIITTIIIRARMVIGIIKGDRYVTKIFGSFIYFCLVEQVVR